jgi:hypothetical protein
MFQDDRKYYRLLEVNSDAPVSPPFRPPEHSRRAVPVVAA